MQRHRFHPTVWEDPTASEQLSLYAITAEPVLWARNLSYWALLPCSPCTTTREATEKRSNMDWATLITARESRPAPKTQHSRKSINQSKLFLKSHSYQDFKWQISVLSNLRVHSQHMHTEKAVHVRGRTKGEREMQLESLLTERCSPTPGPNLEAIGKRPSENCPHISNSATRVGGDYRSESAHLFFHTYAASNK